MFKNDKKLCLIFLFWLLIIPALFSAYVGKPLAFSEVRHYIPILISIVVFSSYGIFHLCKISFLKRSKFFYYIIIAIILISLIFYLPYLTSKKSPVITAQQDYEFIIQSLDNIPNDCLIITQESYLFDFFDRSATSIYLKDLELKGGCLFYYRGELCYREELRNTCREFEERLDLEPFLTNGRHIFYKIQ